MHKSSRCTACGIQYPPDVAICFVCDQRTWKLYKTGPDPDWRERVEALTGVSLGTEQAKIAYATAHPHDGSAKATVTFANDHLWLAHNELTEIGYINLEAGSVVWVNDRFYELQGRSSRTRMRDYYWWVEEIVIDGAADDLTPEMFLEQADG